MSKPTSHASSLQISHAPPLTAHTGDADLKVINDADLLDLSDFSIDIADGERLRAAWLDPESYDYVEVSAVMSVRELDNGDEDPVVYRVLKINQDIEGGGRWRGVRGWSIGNGSGIAVGERVK